MKAQGVRVRRKVKNRWSMQTCGNTSSALRLSSDFLVSTKCKVIFAAASFRDSSAQFLSLRGGQNLVSCPIVLSTYSSTSYCLKQFSECLLTAHVVLALDYSEIMTRL